MNYNPFNLNGKSVVVTGASSGIGRQCAIDCSKLGARVALLARNEQRLQDTLKALHGENHITLSLDLTESKKLVQAVPEICAEMGKIDGLVNCAGISTTLPLKLMSHEKISEMVIINTVTALELTREFSKIKYMNSGSSIIFISSIMGCVGVCGKSLYALTKGALISAAKSLACEFAKRKIRVNCISPGAILTPINEKLPHMADTERRAELESRHLLGLGETTDISSGVIYLLSNASRWVTGQNLIIDGGYTAQ